MFKITSFFKDLLKQNLKALLCFSFMTKRFRCFGAARIVDHFSVVVDYKTLNSQNPAYIYNGLLNFKSHTEQSAFPPNFKIGHELDIEI